jgi:probable HAF family extracellular repeat protein
MKPGKYFIAVAILAAFAFTARLAAQEEQGQKEERTEHYHYKLIDIGTFGGPNSYFTFISGRSLNNHGVATGSADTPVAVNPPLCLLFPDCFLAHTFQWKDGVFTDLGALPGVGGSFPNDMNAKGVIAGLSLNGGSDPVLGVPFFDAVVWKNGQIIDLGTFGGPLSYAGAINNHDRVVGFALNATPASFDLGDFCQNFAMPTEMRAFVWDRGVKRDLGTLGGTDSCALFVNDRGQAAGHSFTNSIVNPGTGFGVPTIHPFFWDGDEMRDLGALGSGTVATAAGINNRGQVAGISNLADNTTFHAFLWDDGKLIDFGSLGGDFVEVIGLNEKGELVGKAQLPGSPTRHAFLAKNGVMIDLGTQEGSPCSVAISINVESQIVGFSEDCALNNEHAFLWENGHMIDLNAFVPSYSTLTLTQATFINDRGEIAAEGVLPNGDQRAVLLIPCETVDVSCVDSADATTGAALRN